jgi:hypothetical protein
MTRKRERARRERTSISTTFKTGSEHLVDDDNLNE